ncbi:endonuclease Q family protein [Orenia marismortui]|uniref:endonuclease Q family protein n=1 Tax=Orenia marismortui TaxID=46469 RepID=UPI00037BA4EA|nr:endonuclease Q family protein [Orenia marismortui]
MKEYFMDLHLHIGRSNSGQAVKITASDKLTIENIIDEGKDKKGIDILGIVDAASPEVIKDIEVLLEQGKLIALEDGGLSYNQEITILLGSEMEVKSEFGQAHLLSYFPYLEDIKKFSSIMSNYISNINLSTQMTYLTAQELFEIVDELGGIIIPAHSFTPHKGLYGSYSDSLSRDAFDKIAAIELGLSADSEMADHLSELAAKTFLSNSDAHSLGKIGREYNKVLVKEASFKEVLLALRREGVRKVLANYGLSPKLGKYHRSYCLECKQKLIAKIPAIKCYNNPKHKIVKGVLDRLIEIADKEEAIHPKHRPAYYHQVPLLDIPGIGPKTLDQLIDSFGSKMNILHKVFDEDLKEIVGRKIASTIIKAREGQLNIIPGGGGKYGKVSN